MTQIHGSNHLRPHKKTKNNSQVSIIYCIYCSYSNKLYCKHPVPGEYVLPFASFLERQSICGNFKPIFQPSWFGMHVCTLLLHRVCFSRCVLGYTHIPRATGRGWLMLSYVYWKLQALDSTNVSKVPGG